MGLHEGWCVDRLRCTKTIINVYCQDQDRISKFIESNWNKRVKDREHALKGWNYGDARIKGEQLGISGGGL